MNAPVSILKPAAEVISAFMYALFATEFVHAFSGAWIEIVCIEPDGAPQWRFFSAHDLKPAIEYAVTMNNRGFNIYAGVALRHGTLPEQGRRGGKAHFCATRFAWIDCDHDGDYDRVVTVCERERLKPAIIVRTGTTPHWRGQLYFLYTETVTDAKKAEDANTALRDLFESDRVQNCDRILRVAGTVSYPTKDKRERGYATEVTAVEIKRDPPTYGVKALCALKPTNPKPNGNNVAIITAETDDHLDRFERYGDEKHREAGGLTDIDLRALLEKHEGGTGPGWHDDMRAVTWELLCRGLDFLNIRIVIASACRRGFDDPDINRLVYKKWEEFQQNKREADALDAKERVAKAKTSSALSLTYYNDLNDSTTKKLWIIKGVLARGETSNWFGAPGLGKSVLMTDLAYHVACGCDWRGHRSKEPCGVVYIALERGSLVKRRLSAYVRKYGVMDLPIAVASNVLDLKNKTCVKLIVDTVLEAEQHFGCKVGLVVIDTLSKGIAAGGGDEDKAKDVNTVLANLRVVEEMTNVHIACVGHTGKDAERGHRGSNANAGDVDLMVQITASDAVKTATVIKINDGEEGPLTHFKIESATLGTDEDGEPITTAVISDEAAEAEQQAKASKGLSKAQRRAMELLTRCINNQGRAAPETSEFPRDVRVVSLEEWQDACERGGLSSAEKKEDRDRAFRRAKDDLQTFNRIACLDRLVWLVRDDG